MKVDYQYPTTVTTTIALMQEFGASCRLIAGGTDLLLMMERQNFRPDLLIDITRIPSLRHLTVDGDTVSIGAAVTYGELLRCVPLVEGAPVLIDAIRQIGGTQVRNIATLVGNITNASPAGDTLPPLYVLGAQVHLQGPEGARCLPIEEFVLGPRRLALRPYELVTHVTFSLLSSGQCGAFAKLGLRRAMAISVASLAVVAGVRDGRVAEVRIATGAVAPTVMRAQAAEQFLVGRALDQVTIDQAAQLIACAAAPIDDVRASASYRRRAVPGLARRCLETVRARAGVEG